MKYVASSPDMPCFYIDGLVLEKQLLESSSREMGQITEYIQTSEE